MLKRWLRSDWFYFRLLTFLAAVYVYVCPLPYKEFDIDYSCILKANDTWGTIIGCLPVRDIGPRHQTHLVRKEEVPTLEEVPYGLIRSVVAIEDRTYFSPILNFMGVNWSGLTRAILSVGSEGGGSGILQQEVKLYLFGPNPVHRNLNRKLTEFIGSINLDHTYSRDHLLLVYLNNVPFRDNVTGVRSAAAHFFGKNLRDLTLDEHATLAGFLNSPIKLTESNEAATRRRNLVLQALLRDGDLSETEYEALRNRPVSLKTLDPRRKNSPLYDDGRSDYESYFITHIKKEAKRELGSLHGLTIYTTYQPRIQAAAEQAVRETLAGFPAEFRSEIQLGLVAVEARTGKIRAMIGSNPFLPQYGGTGTNFAISRHQAGSTFKPFVYGALLSKRSFGLTTRLPDRPIAPYHWNPGNFDGRYSNVDVTVATCLAKSLNIPTANLVKRKLISVERVIRFAQDCGIETPQPWDATIVLGSGDVTPVELAGAYGTIANQGVRRRPFALLSARRNGQSRLFYLQSGYREYSEPHVSRRAAGLLKTGLRGVLQPGGTAANVASLYAEAGAFGKTGTTSNYRDAWFVGFSPGTGLSTAIWLGYPRRNKPLPRQFNTGATTAAPIWGRMMRNCTQPKARIPTKIRPHEEDGEVEV